MSTQVILNHKTIYSYDRLVQLSPQIIRLKPAAHCRIPINSYSLSVKPANHFINWYQDPNANYLARLIFPHKTDLFEINVDIVATIKPANFFDFWLDSYAENYPFRYDKKLAHLLVPYLKKKQMGNNLAQYVSSISVTKKNTVDWVMEVNRNLAQYIAYVIRLEQNIQEPEDTLKLKQGSCRDSAWLLVNIFRYFGLASRFVSGYLIQLNTDSSFEVQKKTDFADLHAWTEVYLPGAGWVGLDPTSGFIASEGHIPLACAAEPTDAAAISGTVEPCTVDFRHSMRIQRLCEEPSSTAPYSEQNWSRILELGTLIDKEFKNNDVRLTMGGEPTFISKENVEDPQWQTQALGKEKLNRAQTLIKNLHAQWAPQGILFSGQGKWYANEALPRWNLCCYWLKNGEALWTEQQLIADYHTKYNFKMSDAHKFIHILAHQLGVEEKNIFSCFELAATDSATLFDRREIAVALPLYYTNKGKWKSDSWPVSTEGLTLIAGDSPAGLRLPFDRLFPRPGRSLPWEKRTTLCVQLRDGALHLFSPPLSCFESFLYLLKALEKTAHETQLPLFLEGYGPINNPRLVCLGVTPDPGVLEVNIQAADNWLDLVNNTTILYKIADQSGLTSSRFLLNGKHISTGGGAHIVVGGPSLADSPFLRRPDLLRSIFSFFNNHPSLSYFFAGDFVGVTSQYPRLDEAHFNSLYELEIAFKELDSETRNRTLLPQEIAAIFGNIIADVRGNTHSVEICTDKLYPVDQKKSQLGLIEFRAFEMAPHPHMNLVQQLLIRVLIAWFWQKPYRMPLVRWGSKLQDAFMLPHFIKEDFQEVIHCLNQSGYALCWEFFAPHFEHRFPVVGHLQCQHIAIELRQALEQWSVLPNEFRSARSLSDQPIDNSMERLQIKVSGLSNERYIILCNGQPIPLHPSSLNDTHIGGVRYIANELPLSMHPTIKSHFPLVFDVFDRQSNTSIGGCTYYKDNPGGKNSNKLPINDREAQSRRYSRFTIDKHSPHSTGLTFTAQENPYFSWTLDLRLP